MQPRTPNNRQAAFDTRSLTIGIVLLAAVISLLINWMIGMLAEYCRNFTKYSIKPENFNRILILIGYYQSAKM